MSPPIDPASARRIEQAMSFLVQALASTGNNPKPVLLHSVRVGMRLLDGGYAEPVVIGALLHDVVEDTAASLEDVERHFGPEVARLVAVNTFDLPELREGHDFAAKRLAYRAAFAAARAAGPSALAIRAADMLDNAAYLQGPDREEPDLWRYLLDKLRDFLAISEEALGDDAIWLALRGRFKELAARDRE